MKNTKQTRYDKSRCTSAKRGYGYKWQVARESFLQSHPLCVEHEKKGRLVAASVVDHIKPHRGDMSLFWDRNNWQPLCKPCHDIYKQRLESTGRVLGCTADGIPIDPKHHWNR